MDPAIHDSARIRLETRQSARGGDAESTVGQTLVQGRQRNDILELRVLAGCVPCVQPAYFTAAPVGAAEIAAIGDQAAAQRSGDQEIEEAAVLLPRAELHLPD